MDVREWTALISELEPERRRAMEFLRDRLPDSDLDCYPASLFLRFADHALKLRREAPWCGALDWEIFAHYVLFPRVNDEDLSFHRELFHNALWPRIRDLSAAEDRVLEVNRWCHEHASYRAQDERTASPLTVYLSGFGRCGEESAFLVSALRSVGIPARQVYAPRWSHCDDNHAWVEALCGDVWRFLGACEPEPVPDRGWFVTAASRAMLIHSRIFGEGSSPLHGEPLGREGAVTWFNQTARYGETRRCTFRALSGGLPAAGAQFRLQVLNEASWHTVAVLTADERGEARAALGRGGLHVAAFWKGLTAGGDCEDGEITLALAPPETGDTPWTDFDFSAPAGLGTPPPMLDGDQKAERAAVLRRGNGLRERRMAGFFRPDRAEWEDLLRAARGNREEILAFLNGPDADGRERLVRTLIDKDLRDVTREILEDHFVHLPPRGDGVPEEVYWRYAACPRIGWEKLSPWRGFLLRYRGKIPESQRDGSLLKALFDPFSFEEKDSVLLRLAASLDAAPNAYENLYWTPEAVLTAGRCDEKSRRVLLIAALRTLGIPARLRPVDGVPELWREGAFRPLSPEQTGTLHLSWTGEATPRYRQDWTLSRWTAEGWQLLELSGEDPAALTLPAGRYRLISSVRLPSGDQLAAQRELELPQDGEKTAALRLRPWKLEDLLTCRPLPAFAARTLDGQFVPDALGQDGGPLLALWLEEGGEPTEHMLGELMERRQALAALPVRILFFLRGRESVNQPTLAKALSCLPGVRVLLDDWAYDLEEAARRLGRDPDSPPLAVICREGRAVYSDCGYRVGAAELLLRVAAMISS